MKAWFLALSERERYLLIVGGTALLAIILWFYAWQPLLSYQEGAQKDIAATAEDLVYLQQARQKILGAQQEDAMAPPKDTTTSVQLLIAPVLKKYQLDTPDILVRSEDKGKDGVSLKLEAAPFDALVLFLGELEQNYAVYATSMALIPADKPGLTGAQLTLER